MARGPAAARGVRTLAFGSGLALLGAAIAASAQPVPASAPEAAPVWTLDPTHTFVHWEVLHMSTSTIRGRFDKAAGNVQFDPKAKRLDVSVTIETASVNSGVPILDKLLQGSAMLDTAANPQAFFVARNASFDGEVPREIRGEFTLRGTSQPLTLRALRWHCGLNPLFRRHRLRRRLRGRDRAQRLRDHAQPAVRGRQGAVADPGRGNLAVDPGRGGRPACRRPLQPVGPPAQTVAGRSASAGAAFRVPTIARPHPDRAPPMSDFATTAASTWKTVSTTTVRLFHQYGNWLVSISWRRFIAAGASAAGAGRRAARQAAAVPWTVHRAP